MSDRRSPERSVADDLGAIGPMPLPEEFYTEIDAYTSRHRQPARWFALFKEPPMRISSSVAVGSPTIRFAAILAATILISLVLATAGIAGARLLAAEGAIVVAQDGSGTFETITEAVAMAEDGDTIEVRPGTYIEAVTIDQDIRLTGDGRVEEIILSAPVDGPTMATGTLATGWGSDEQPYALQLTETDAEIAGLSFSGPGSAVAVSGGSPTLEGLRFDGSRPLHPYGAHHREELAIVITDASTALVRDNTLLDGAAIGVFDGADPRIIENSLEGETALIIGGFGDAAVVQDNTVTGFRSGGVWAAIGVYNPSALTIAGNRIEVTTGTAIRVGDPSSSPDGVDPIVRGNVITGASTGILAKANTEPWIQGNELVENSTAIALNGSDAAVEANVISGGLVGLGITGGSPVLTANSVEGSGRGISINIGGSLPSLVGNVVCGNEVNLFVAEGEETPDTSGNEICADTPTQTTE